MEPLGYTFAIFIGAVYLVSASFLLLIVRSVLNDIVNTLG